MKRILTVFLSIALIFSFTSIVVAKPVAPEAPSAPNGPSRPDTPEVSGDYAVPNRSDIRVRVFVHGPKPKQPTESVTATVCVDPDSNAAVDWAGWKLPQGVWTYQLNPGSAPSSVGGSNAATISATVFNTWQQAVNNKVSFARGSDTSLTRSAFDSKNIVAWGRTSSRALGVTYVTYYVASREVADVDTILNKRVPWGVLTSCGDTTRYDFQDILTHELGHWIGLDDEYDVSYVDNTMYGYGSKGEIKKNTLTTGDRANLATMYP